MVKPRSAPAPTLGPEAWVAAGLRALGEGGVEAVRVEVLARVLAVTKGSFYWHFADRRALLDAMAARWEQSTTTDVITAVEADGGSGADRLRRLIALCFRGNQGATIGRLESALRRWGSTDDAVRPILGRVDTARLAYVTGLLIEHGLTPATARLRARLLYLAMIGEFAWTSHGGAPTPRRTLEALGELLLGA
jgi:AcrR family transcriptional regulator